MNASKIRNLSGQYYALEGFKDRCTWDSADFGVGEFLLDKDTSKRINSGIQEVVKAEIIKIQTELIKAIKV